MEVERRTASAAHSGTRMSRLKFRSFFFSFEIPFCFSDLLKVVRPLVFFSGAGHHDLKINTPKIQVYYKIVIQVEVDKVRMMAHYQPRTGKSKRRLQTNGGNTDWIQTVLGTGGSICLKI